MHTSFLLRCSVLLLTFLVLSFSACTSFVDFSSSPQTVRQAPKITEEFQETEDVTVSSEPLRWDNQEFDVFTKEVLELIENRDFAGLDVMATDLRSRKARFQKGGGWKIHSFYALTSSPNQRTENDLVDRIKFLNDWKKTTQSIAARASLADAYVEYAWLARGDGFASEVKPDAWPVVEDRMRLAAIEIDELFAMKERCYGVFEASLQYGRTGGWDRSRYEKMFQEAIAYDPSYQYFYTEMAQYLLPRWDGRPGELTDFANNLVSTYGDVEGSKLYYLVVAELNGYKHDTDLFRATGLSWSRTKKGFVQYEKEHGITRFRLNQFAALSLKAKDTQAACSTFKRIAAKNDFDESVWKSRKAFENQKAVVLNLMCQFPRADNQAN